MYKHGLICGRFQPLHLGHVSLIQKAIQECTHLTIAIGSAQDNIDYRNPYTYPERYSMLKNVFLENILNNSVSIIPISDINNPPKWARYVLGNVLINSYSNDKVDIYYSGSEHDASLFRDYGITIKISDRSISGFKSATEIRDLISKNDVSWKKYTPEANWDLISRLGINLV